MHAGDVSASPPQRHEMCTDHERRARHQHPVSSHACAQRCMRCPVPADTACLAVCAPGGGRFANAKGVREGVGDSDASACPYRCDKGYTTREGATSKDDCFREHQLGGSEFSSSAFPEHPASNVGWCGGAGKANSNQSGVDEADDCDFDNLGYGYVACMHTCMRGPSFPEHPAAAARPPRCFLFAGGGGLWAAALINGATWHARSTTRLLTRCALALPAGSKPT